MEKEPLSTIDAERNRESRESREAEIDPELAAAAAMERADYLVKEVKNTKKQVQNIAIHMQQVVQVIRQLREQLQLVQAEEDPSVAEYQHKIASLKAKILEHQTELEQMRGDLEREQLELLTLDPAYAKSPKHHLEARARQLVDEMIRFVHEDT